MKWVFYSSLTAMAKKAFNQGDGKRYGFVIDNGHIATITNKKDLKFYKVIKGVGPIIEEQRGN